MTNKLSDPIKAPRGGVVRSAFSEIEDQLEAPCDFDSWGKMSRWTLSQAHQLSFACSPLEPRSVYQHDQVVNSISSHKNPVAQSICKVWALIKNAYEAYDLHDPVKPIKFIAWADLHEVDIPKELRESVEKMEQRRAGQEQQSESRSQLSEIQYIPPYVVFMLEAVTALNLSSDSRSNLDEIINWLDDNWPSDLEGKSQNLVKYMATLLRRPEDKRGGNTPWK